MCAFLLVFVDLRSLPTFVIPQRKGLDYDIFFPYPELPGSAIKFAHK